MFIPKRYETGRLKGGGVGKGMGRERSREEDRSREIQL
jgi:hypothetical protein